MDNKARLLSELQMLTGIMTDDYEYMLYMLLKKGNKEKEVITANQYEKTEAAKIDKVQSLEDWFDTITEVVDDS